MAKCSCWEHYPNKLQDKRGSGGKWKCIEEYRCIRDLEEVKSTRASSGLLKKRKTVCERILTGDDVIFKKIMAVPDIPICLRGEKFHTKCPCGGVITSWREPKDGHLRASCDKCGWRVVE
jgi:hypothetical protein